MARRREAGASSGQIALAALKQMLRNARSAGTSLMRPCCG